MGDSQAPAKTSRIGVLADRNFLLFALSRFLSTAAIMMQSVAVGWQVYAHTGNVTSLGWVGLAQFLPFLVFILPSGQVADRHDRVRILVVCNAGYLVGSLFLFGHTLAGTPTIAPVFATLVLLGTSRAFAMPANQAALRNIVRTEDFGQAVAFNSTAFHAAVVLGPLLGGVLYLAGPAIVHATVSTSLVVATALLFLVRTRHSPDPEDAPAWRKTLEGIRFVRSRPLVLGAISLDLFAVLLGGATAMLPVFAHDVLHADSRTLGLLRASPAIGAAAMTLLLAWRPIRRRVGTWMFGGVLLFGVCTIVFGLSPHAWLSVASLLLLGAGDMVSVFVRHILVQTQTPDALRGRVSAVNSVFIGASNELGEFESGMMAGWLGLVPSVVAGGAATIAVVFAWMALFPGLRRLDRFPEEVRGA